MKHSGASNRGRQRQAEAERHAEAAGEPLHLANLDEREAAQLRQLLDELLWGALDPRPATAEAPPDDGEEG